MYLNKKILIICFLITFFSFSQENITIKYMDSQIEDLIKISTKKTTANIAVYSIQLKASEKPETIRKTKNYYKSLFPTEIINEIFEPPYFKIIIGAYLDKKKAEKKLQKLQKKFKSAFVLKREIPIEQFKKYQKTN